MSDFRQRAEARIRGVCCGKRANFLTTIDELARNT